MRKYRDKLKFIGFGSMKGGVGKTSIMEIFASYLAYHKGYKVLVIDVDNPQWSFYMLREREINLLNSDQIFSKKVEERRGLYPDYEVLSFLPSRYIEKEEELLEERADLDYVLIDLPGRYDKEVLSITLKLDILLCPVEEDRQSLEASASFGQYISLLKNNQISSGADISLQICSFWNKEDKRIRRDLKDRYDIAFSKVGLEMLKTHIPSRSKISKEYTIKDKSFFRSSLLAPKLSDYEDTNLIELIEEVLEKIK